MALWAGGVAVAASSYGALIYLLLRGLRIGLTFFVSARRMLDTQRQLQRRVGTESLASPRLFDLAAVGAEQRDRRTG